ncbi:hypothetical protein [Spiroplasma turonicum]|uniref:Lipoprotein n=1 Tax=Spiroplasma turonicum TaxID=216946 RepID=A0A0K1P6I8_9MOLU|nr:hypothetical protein [Spiroplasma turonicum]AKU79918.1 hypothetical protein STURON_00672 [Spiroplasma turonicum]ALX70931.1 hypothetical protein STURO_v1c06720 [Spiroplasma turonicum]
MKKLSYILISFGLMVSSTASLISCDFNNNAMSGCNSMPNGGEVEKTNPEQNSKSSKSVKILECEFEDLDVFANNETDWKTINKTYNNEIENVKKV